MIRKLLFIALITSSLYAELDLNQLDQFIEAKRKEYNVPGVSVAIVRGDEPILIKGYGLTQIGKEEKVNEATIFQLASVTKSFTAAALGIQVDKGRLKWDDEVIKHLPAFALFDPYPTRFTTTRDLLAHRTGLPAFGGDLLGKLGYTSEEILYRIRFIEPAASFREKALYSNVGYFAAGELLGALSNSTWEEAIQSDLLTPLQMDRSGFAKNLDQPNVAYAHAEINGKIKIIPWDRTGGFPAAGAITSTAENMAHWMSMLLNQGKYNEKIILKSETIKSLFEPTILGEIAFSEAPPIDENSCYAFTMGWDSYRYQEYYIIEKGGGLDGMRSVVLLIPDLNYGITILSNLNLTLLPEAIRAEFLERIIGKSDQDLQSNIKKQGTVLAKMIQPEAKPENALPLGHKLSQYVGTFSNQLYGDFIVKEENQKLKIDAGPAHLAGTLTPFSNDTFLLSWPAINSGYQQLTFTFGPNGKANSFKTENLGIFIIKE